jgi:hypothetical protein
MVRILCATFGQLKHENGVPPLVFGNARSFSRLLFLGGVSGFSNVSGADKNAFSPTIDISHSRKKGVLNPVFNGPEKVENPETRKQKTLQPSK